MKTTLKGRLEKIRQSHDYRLEKAKLEFIQSVWRLMTEKGISNIELSRRLETSPAYITKIMRGDANFTLDSMVKISQALDCKVHIHVASRNADVRWLEAFDCAKLAKADSRKIREADTKIWGNFMHHSGESLKGGSSEACRVYA
ncbi:MAG: helix-turn-helix domain-containing protein [Thiopseudomonas sp.]